MDEVHRFISDVEAFARKAGMSPERVCRNATNNPRFFERFPRRANDLCDDMRRVREYMAQHPDCAPSKGAE